MAESGSASKRYGSESELEDHKESGKGIQLEARLEDLHIASGRAGATKLGVIQTVEVVKEKDKLSYLLKYLQWTRPPVLIFSENSSRVEIIFECLRMFGINAVSVHSGLNQHSRQWALQMFKDGREDVLVATDAESKGVHFEDIQHVINYDMPGDIENYVSRIGHTDVYGFATTFINNTCTVSVLLELKQILMEAKQKIPPVLRNLELQEGDYLKLGDEDACWCCGSLDHKIRDCLKMRYPN